MIFFSESVPSANWHCRFDADVTKITYHRSKAWSNFDASCSFHSRWCKIQCASKHIWICSVRFTLEYGLRDRYSLLAQTLNNFM